ncbi:hypothetical protein N802_07660 [Knoellia sinensis KCTC 19936]|uniref:DUF3311 domain-containing protein n=1 Tax=Knoellia sinensis KCTC 19936 TaxID=1385520 RepID=A0A0A0JDH1_9MICO|nr:hypothetical protein N802_07660 [Knoellia sinensis KCTC 19936]
MDHDTVPPANKGMLAVAGVLLLIPIVALMWVSSYARVEPKLWGFPFFIWYQFLWVFLCSAMTYTAYRLVLKARPHRPMGDAQRRPRRHRGRHEKGATIGDTTDADLHDGNPFDADGDQR